MPPRPPKTTASTAGGSQPPKYKWLKTQLLRRIKVLQPGDALPTVAEMRKSYEVSQATVERALNELRQEGRIRSRRGSGIYVSQQTRLRQVALLIPFDIFNPQYSEFTRLLLHALQRAATDRDMLLRHYMPHGGSWQVEQPFEVLKHDLQFLQISGVVAIEAWVDKPLDLPLPAVGIEALPQFANRVIPDRMAAISMGVRALADLGCKKLALIGEGREPGFCIEHETFRRAATDLGLPVQEAWIANVNGSLPQHYVEGGRKAICQLWSAIPGDRPDGLLCLDDYATKGVLESLPELGIRPSVDLHIASHANLGSPLLVDAPLWKMEFDPSELAVALLDLLEDVISGNAHGETRYVAPRLRSPED